MPLFRRNVCNRGSPQCRSLTHLAVFVSAFSLAVSANAATYYVATTGSDSNPGTQAAPFRTIAKGSQAMSGGDTLYIRAGTYGEAMMHKRYGFVFQNGTSSAYTRYAAYPGEERKVIIRPPLETPKVGYAVWCPITCAYIELSGLVIDGLNIDYGLLKFDYKATTLEHANHIRILNNEIIGYYEGGRGVKNCIGMPGDNEIIGNSIHGTGAYGIYAYLNNGLIERNVIYDNGGYGLNLYYQEGSASGWVIRNNIFYGNGIKGHVLGAAGTEVSHFPAVLLSRGSNQFYNNLVYNNYGGIQVGFGAVDSLVANNTIYGNEAYGIFVSGAFTGSQNARVINNIVWGNSGAQITDTGTNTTIQNNLTTDPHVVSAAGGDFHLTSGSTNAIDKGITQSAVPNDFDYGARPYGAAYDIGAFEFGAPPGTTPSPPIPAGGISGGVGAGAGGGRSGFGGLSNCAR